LGIVVKPGGQSKGGGFPGTSPLQSYMFSSLINIMCKYFLHGRPLDKLPRKLITELARIERERELTY